MGVSGCGKTQTSRALAAELGVRYIEADDFHPAENLAQMRVGLPLTDAQRIGWLQALGDE
ncbi:MAG: gluconokinase, partial [Pseudomonadaceae bacterium]